MAGLTRYDALAAFSNGLTHYIAAPPNRLDIVLAARCAGEFFSQLANKYVDDLHLWLVHTAVEVAQKHFLGERRALAQRQEFQHLVLLAGQIHACAVDLDRLAIEIDTQIVSVDE